MFGKVETKAGDECDFAQNSRAFYGYVVRVVVQTVGRAFVGSSAKAQEGGLGRLLALLYSEPSRVSKLHRTICHASEECGVRRSSSVRRSDYFSFSS